LLAGVARSVVYGVRKPVRVNEQELALLTLIDAEYTRHPFLGSRKMRVFLRGCGHVVSRKRIQRLMRRLGLAAMAPGPNTSKPHPQHKIYPYLLRGVNIIRPNQAWSTDITYIRLPRGFVYLVAVIDWYSRKVWYWPGVFPTPWMPDFVWIACSKLCNNMADRRYSTLIRAASLPAARSRMC
jgi:putative transposase